MLDRRRWGSHCCRMLSHMLHLSLSFGLGIEPIYLPTGLADMVHYCASLNIELFLLTDWSSDFQFLVHQVPTPELKFRPAAIERLCHT